MADMRTHLACATADRLKQNYGRFIKCYQTVIPVFVKAAETDKINIKFPFSDDLFSTQKERNEANISHSRLFFYV